MLLSPDQWPQLTLSAHLDLCRCPCFSVHVIHPQGRAPWRHGVEFHVADQVCVLPLLICCCILSATMISLLVPVLNQSPSPNAWPAIIREFCPSFLPFSLFLESLSLNGPCVFVFRDITDGILGITVANREQRAFRRISLSPGGEGREGRWGADLKRVTWPYKHMWQSLDLVHSQSPVCLFL